MRKIVMIVLILTAAFDLIATYYIESRISVLESRSLRANGRITDLEGKLYH